MFKIKDVHPLDVFPGLSFAGVLFAPVLAFANPPTIGQPCNSDAHCSTGETCEILEHECPKACPDGQTCSGECSPETYGSCQPASCASDADCGNGTLCIEFEGTRRICAPHYMTACDSSAECGTGPFACTLPDCPCADGNCNSQVIDAGLIAPGDAHTDGAGGHECPANTPKECAVGHISCTNDDDCSDAWTCQQDHLVGISDCPESEDEDGCGPIPRVCRPADYDYWQAFGRPGIHVEISDAPADGGVDSVVEKEALTSTDASCSVANGTRAGREGSWLMLLIAGLCGARAVRRRAN